jgi:hypothetical protein
MHQRIRQKPEKERGGDARRVDGRAAVAEQDADDASNESRDHPRKRALGEIFVSQRDEHEHAVAKGERDSERRLHEAADQITAEIFDRGCRHAEAGLKPWHAGSRRRAAKFPGRVPENRH